jgi:hypothetical protein
MLLGLGKRFISCLQIKLTFVIVILKFGTIN